MRNNATAKTPKYELFLRRWFGTHWQCTALGLYPGLRVVTTWGWKTVTKVLISEGECIVYTDDGLSQRMSATDVVRVI